MAIEDAQSDEHVAYHEAGHAVVAHVVGGQIVTVTIETVEYPEGTERGRTNHWIAGLDKELQCRLAGGASTLKKFGGRDGATHDLRECLRALNNAGYGDWSHDEKSAYLEKMDRCATVILEQHWSAVQALAAALIEHRTLGGADAHRMVEAYSE